MKKILLTGCNGQLGIDVFNTLSNDYCIIKFDKKDLDITNLDDVINIVKIFKPNIIVNCAAYTNVDLAEINEDLAYNINATGAKNLAIASLANKSKLVHISTDFIFDGKKNTPYLEYDTPNPLNIYGKSKLLGEELIKQINPNHYILRTSWLYGKYGNNFVKTILNLCKENKLLRIVNDQIGTPTHTKHLVDIISMLIQTDAYGIYHASNDGKCSWFEFTKEILKLCNINNIDVIPITTEELNRPAKRPEYSVMENHMLKLFFNYKEVPWEKSLIKYFNDNTI